MPNRAELQIVGLAKLRRALKEIDPALQKELRTALLPIVEPIVQDARSRVPIGKTGKAAKSIRGGVSGNNIYVQGGRSTVPYYGWLDFGVRAPKRGNPRTVGPWTKSGPGPDRGRFIYPAVDANREHTEEVAVQAIADIVAKAIAMASDA